MLGTEDDCSLDYDGMLCSREHDILPHLAKSALPGNKLSRINDVDVSQLPIAHHGRTYGHAGRLEPSSNSPGDCMVDRKQNCKVAQGQEDPKLSEDSLLLKWPPPAQLIS